MKKPSPPGTLLRVVADLVDRLSPAEVNALLEGRSRIEVVGRVPQAKVPRSKALSADTSALLDRLRDARTREDAALTLQADGITKAALEGVARALDLPILRSDTVDRLRDKIVEAVVGYRINSDAIRGRTGDGPK